MTGGRDQEQLRKAFSALLRRDTIVLILLATAIVPLFFFTRTMAAWNRENNLAAGRTWYERASEPLKKGLSGTAIEYLRKATAADRDNLQYSLSLAEALNKDGQSDEARQILLRLRTVQPEDGRINLDLARLAANGGEAGAARNYYHQALYGMWPVGQLENEQSGIRLELVRFLLTQQDTSNAISELLILAANSPADAANKTELGSLFLQADEPGRALYQFLDAIKIQPTNTAALTGAGEAEFKLGNDESARRRLQSAEELGPLSPDAQHTFELAGLILSDDALANGIGMQERVRRLTLSLRRAADRLEACGAKPAPSDPGALQALKGELIRITAQVSRGETADLNLLRDGLKIAASAENAGKAGCGPMPAADEAIILVAERHKLGTP